MSYQDQPCSIMGCLPMGASLEPGETSNLPMLIEFSIGTDFNGTNEVTYQAIEGMTWADWVSSEYNEGNYFLSDNMIYKTLYSYRCNLYYDNYTFVVSTDVIESNHLYRLTAPGSGN